MKIEEVVYSGDCLEALGIPPRGVAVVDRDLKPEVFDLVWCDGCFGGELGGFLKQVIQNSKTPVVRTRYKNGDLDYSFYPKKIFATVLKIMDIDKNVVWERPAPMKYLPIKCSLGEWVYALWSVPTKERFIIYTAEVKEIRHSKRFTRDTTTYRLEPIEFRGRLREYFDEDFGTLVFNSQEEAEDALEKEKLKYAQRRM